MSHIINDLINNLVFTFERLDWLGVLDLLLVTAIIFTILRWLRDTQALVLLRGVFLLIALISLLTSLEVLPAFSWLMRTTLPALLLAIPVIFVAGVQCGASPISVLAPGKASDFPRDSPSNQIPATVFERGQARSEESLEIPIERLSQRLAMRGNWGGRGCSPQKEI